MSLFPLKRWHKNFNSALFSQVKTVVFHKTNVNWSVLSSSSYMLQVESLWIDAVEQVEQMYQVGSFCALQLLCIEKLKEDVQTFLQFQAFPALEYFICSETKNSSMQLWLTTGYNSGTYLGASGSIDCLRKHF